MNSNQKNLRWGKMSGPTPVFLKGLRNYCMKVGTLLTGAAGATGLYLKEHSKNAPVPDYAWYVVLFFGMSGVFCTTVLVPFIQSFYLEDHAPVSKK